MKKLTIGKIFDLSWKALLVVAVYFITFTSGNLGTQDMRLTPKRKKIIKRGRSISSRFSIFLGLTITRLILGP